MKLMFASDIHGGSNTCMQLIEAFHAEKADKLVLLGDLLYHGPCNELPGSYAPKNVITQLNEIREKLVCVRGNCDAEVDQMVLTFPIMAEYTLLEWQGHLIYATHGHHANPDNPPPLIPGDILFNGHTHVPAIRRCQPGDMDFLYLNPGSITIPKQGSAKGYMLLDDAIYHKTLDGEVLQRVTLADIGW